MTSVEEQVSALYQRQKAAAEVAAYVGALRYQRARERKKEEKAEGKSGWAAYRWKRDLLERMSIAIAKGNWALLDAHTPVRPFGAAA